MIPSVLSNLNQSALRNRVKRMTHSLNRLIEVLDRLYFPDQPLDEIKPGKGPGENTPPDRTPHP